MAYTAPSTDLRGLYATTAPLISKNIADGISGKIPLLLEIKKAGNFKEVVGGGTEFHEPAIVGESSAVGGYKKGTVLNINEQDGIDKFAYTPSFFYGTVRMDGTELAMNAGDPQAVELLSARIQQMELSAMNGLSAYIHGLETDPNVQFGWLGLQNLVPDSPSATILGTGVDRTVYTEAQNQVVTTAIASATAWNTSNAGRNVMTDLYNKTAFGGERPKFGIMTRTLYNAYSISLQANERFVDAKETANGGYPNLTFMNDCKITFGDDVLAGHFYFLNPKFLKFKILKGKNFKMGKFIEAINGDYEVAKMTLGGQFTTNSPRYHGVYIGGGF